MLIYFLKVGIISGIPLTRTIRIENYVSSKKETLMKKLESIKENLAKHEIYDCYEISSFDTESLERMDWWEI